MTRTVEPWGRRLRRPGLAVVAALLPLAAAHAAEGMWTLDKLPAKDLQARYGFTPDAAWVQHAQRSSLRLAGGCSGSFVSPDGLVLTNHHCVRECVQQLSTAKKNFVADGFYAKEQKDEVLCPTIELNRLDEISDVTARVKKATSGLQGAAFSKAQKAEQSKIEAECVGADKERTRCDVVELYHGGVYDVYKYHRFQDARLVFAPDESIAFFGGDPDNFNFPRYDLDMGILRAYEDGKPAKVADYFPFSKNGAEENELTMVLGHPGSTQRQLTIAQLERRRDVDLPSRLMYAAEERGMLNQFASESPESARTSEADRFYLENSIKALKGQEQALLDPEVFNYKRKQESELRAFVNGSPARKAKYGKAWDEIAAVQANYREFEMRWKFIEGQRGFQSDYFGFARDLVRGAAERGKPNSERLHEFTDGALPTLTQELFSDAPIYPAFEQVELGWSLTKLREWLGADDATVRQVLGKEAPELMAKRLVETTKLGDPAVRKALWDGGQAAIDASTDPFILLARQVDPEARALRKRYEDEVEAVEKKNAELLAQARFEKYGTSVYPDATFTLRLSDGVVKGWNEKGVPVKPFTEIAGAFDRATGFDPFKLPDSWIKAKDQLNGAQRFDFVTSNDIIGGNSGSPMINRKGEIVGLVFDGNIESLGGAYWFDERVNRTVAVHSGAIVEALRKVYGADRIVNEIEAGRNK
ncbi:S46 family peptidase [Nevskia soli]|uniref:S46 family peptidase n=1 Tax=Nevskia soli TaxID=418856 RepID=UPI0006918DAE|nr:S46 family peptidase [Nevskia soli]